jgi:hypothetical protein
VTPRTGRARPAQDDQHVTYTEGVVVLACQHSGATLDGLHDAGLALVRLDLTRLETEWRSGGFTECGGKQWKTAGGHACAVRHLFAGQAQFMALPGYPPTQIPWPIGHGWCPPPSCPSCCPPSVCERAQRIRRADHIAGRDPPFGQAADTARGPGRTGRQGGQLILGRSGSARHRVVLASASRSGGPVAPVVVTGRCSGLRSGPRQYSLGTIYCCACSAITAGIGE